MSTDNTGAPMDFPGGGLTAGNQGLDDLQKGLTQDGIQQYGSVGNIPTEASNGYAKQGNKG